MRITIDRDAALNDPANRKEAAKIIAKDTPDLFAEADADTINQWIDDLIHEWVDQYQHDCDTGAYDDWRPDPVYESQYAHACGYYD